MEGNRLRRGCINAVRSHPIGALHYSVWHCDFTVHLVHSRAHGMEVGTPLHHTNSERMQSHRAERGCTAPLSLIMEMANYRLATRTVCFNACCRLVGTYRSELVMGWNLGVVGRVLMLVLVFLINAHGMEWSGIDDMTKWAWTDRSLDDCVCTCVLLGGVL